MKNVFFLFNLIVLGTLSVKGSSNPINPTKDKPARLYVENYTYSEHAEIHPSGEGYGSDGAQLYSFQENGVYTWGQNNWTDGQGGNAIYHSSGQFDTTGSLGIDSGSRTLDETHQWPSSDWPNMVDGTETSSSTLTDNTGAIFTTHPDPWTIGPPGVADLGEGGGSLWIGYEHCDMNGNQPGSRTWSDSYGNSRHAQDNVVYSRKADTTMKLFTGGKAFSHENNLYVLSASAQVTPGMTLKPNLLADGDYWEYDWPPEWQPSQRVYSTDIEIDQRPLGSDGKLWRTYDDNVTRDVTPQVSADYYTFNEPPPTKYEPTITANDNQLDPNGVVSDAFFCVGQSLKFDIDDLPDDAVGVAYWHLPELFVNERPHPDICDLYYDKNPNLLICPSSSPGGWSTSCWYVDKLHPGTASVDLQLYFPNGQNVHLAISGQFDMSRPSTAKATPYQPDGTPTAQILSGTLSLGVSGVANDMNFQHTITTDAFCAGQAAYVQLITSGEYTSSGTGLPLPPIPNTELDGKYGEFPADRQTSVPANATTTLNKFYDAPSDGLHQGNAQEDLEFSTYLMFNPNSSGSIWVPLRLITWAVQDEAANGTLVNGAQYVTGPSDNESTTFPDWQGTWIRP